MTAGPRLDFDGGPWVGGFPLSHTSPWAEVALGTLVGAILGTLLPDPGWVKVAGVLLWLLLSPAAVPVALLAWILTGTWLWWPASPLLGLLGWGAVGGLVADLVQGFAPLSFPARLGASLGGAGVVVLSVGVLIGGGS